MIFFRTFGCFAAFGTGQFSFISRMTAEQEFCKCGTECFFAFTAYKIHFFIMRKRYRKHTEEQDHRHSYKKRKPNLLQDTYQKRYHYQRIGRHIAVGYVSVKLFQLFLIRYFLFFFHGFCLSSVSDKQRADTTVCSYYSLLSA